MAQLDGLELSEGIGNLGGRLVAGSDCYPTIQEAWDDADDGDTVYVHSSYDAQSAGENFPIVIDQNEKEVALVGGHPSGSEINASHASDRNVIEVYGRGSADYRNTPLISNLKIVGGRVGIQVVSAPNASFAHLKLFNNRSHGAHITTTGDDSTGSFGTRWYDCEAWSNGGDGFRADREARPHGTTFIRCNATWNGWANHGSGVHLTGYSSVFWGGTAQRNSRYGINVLRGGSQVVRDSYFESNGLEANIPVQLRLTNTFGSVVEGCYFLGRMLGASSHMDNVQGHDRVARAIQIHGARGCTVKCCTHRHHRSGFIAVQGTGAWDNDVHESSHYQIGSNDRFIVRDSADRTRSNGIIIEQDLRGVDGQFVGDRGIHNGSGSASWGLCMWNGSNWVNMVDGQSL